MERFMLHFRDKWDNFQESFTRGKAFVKGNLLEGRNLSRYYFENSRAIADALYAANGFFGLVIKGKNGFMIASDKIRSFPLFYSTANSKAIISDDPYWIMDQLKGSRNDEISEKELLLTGFVSGNHTLCKGVEQMLPGEIIRFELENSGRIRVTHERYYRFIHKDYFDLPKEELLKKHEEVLADSFRRLMAIADGRPIVIPLSGGYDSRMTAVTLKKLGYENVITYTFGRHENNDYKVARKVAGRLGFKSIFIEYDNEKAYKWFNSTERKECGRRVDNLSSSLLDREWPALLELTNQRLIPENSILVPGHSGDFISGNTIPKALFKKDFNEELLIESIYRKYYVMWNWSGQKEQLLKLLSSRLKESMEANEIHYDDSANAFEKWSWQEPIVKYFVNPIKVYEYFNYDWWMPLWDSEYIEFWTRIPLEFRLERNLYKEYVFRLYSQVAEVSMEEAKERESSYIKEGLIDRTLKYIRTNYLKNSLMKVQKKELRETDWEVAYGKLNEKQYNKILPYIVGRSSCATLERLGYIRYTDEDVPEETIRMLKQLRGF